MSQFERLQKAAALKYAPTPSDSAPVVVASGVGYAAQKIIEIAQDSGVPVFQDNSLASLLSQLHSGTQIPPELYRAIVDIYVYFLGFTVNASGKAVRVPQPAPPAPETDGPETDGPEPDGPETDGPEESEPENAEPENADDSESFEPFVPEENSGEPGKSL